MPQGNEAMCRGGLVFWLNVLMIIANIVMFIYQYRTWRLWKMDTAGYEKLWHRRLDEAEKLRIQARKLRDEWKIANMLSKATIGAKKGESE
jgi:hypothetical protein